MSSPAPWTLEVPWPACLLGGGGVLRAPADLGLLTASVVVVPAGLGLMGHARLRDGKGACDAHRA